MEKKSKLRPLFTLRLSEEAIEALDLISQRQNRPLRSVARELLETILTQTSTANKIAS